MLRINDYYYDLDVVAIITELKNQLAVNGIFLFNSIKELPDDVMISCPFHKDGQERKPSCGVRKEDGWVHCFACGESSSLAQMISRCLGYNDLGQQGLGWLKTNFLGDISVNRNLNLDLSRNTSIIKNQFVTEDELKKYRYYHEYMFKRKMTEEVIEKFDIGYDVNTNCITFPVRDSDGNCLFVARRSVIGKYFNYPTNIEKPVYGLYELPNNVDEIIICESMINCITCYVYRKCAVALNGTGTEYQISQLSKLNCRKFILALDPDEAGEKGCNRIYKSLHRNKIITKYVIPKGKDINDLTREEFENLQEIFL